jgi:hypothetical protein
MAVFHKRYYNWMDFATGSGNPPEQQRNLMIFDPGVTSTLVRSRLWIEMRVEAYSQADSQQPDLEWFANIFPVVGLEYFSGSAPPIQSNLPIGGLDANDWIIWDPLAGSNEQVVTSPHGWLTWSRVYKSTPYILESFAQRAPGANASQTVWLAWEWNDPNNLLNRSHASFDLVYDTQVMVTCDTFWKEH